MVILNYLKAISTISFITLFTIFIVSCENESTIESQGGNLPKVVSFTADPSTVPVGGDTVKLSWIVNNANSLSITPGIGTVTPVDTGSIKIFVDSSTAFKLTATNSEGSASANTQVSVVQPMTVNGFVYDIDGVPLPGVTVIIEGKSPVSTGAGGDFSISNVLPPYQIRIIVGSINTAMIYKGLTRPDPTLYYVGSTSSEKLAVINGNVPPAPGKYTQIFYVTSTMAWSTLADQTTGAYTINAKWKGTTNSFIGRLHVLRWLPDSVGLPMQYDAYGFQSGLSVSSGGIFGYYNFSESDFTNPAEQNISGSITLPASSYKIFYKSLSLNFNYVSVKLIDENGTALSSNFRYPVPVITDASYEVDAAAQITSTPNNRITFYRKRLINGGSSGVTINLESTPALNLPLYNTTGIDTTTQFSWFAVSGVGINLVRITPAFVGPTYYILTSENTTTIPNLSAQGLGLPPNTGYSWEVNQLFPFASMDIAASINFTQVLLGSIESGYANSEKFQFTTHP
jgi:hypothetical protein